MTALHHLPARASLFWLAPVLFIAFGCGTKTPPAVVAPPPALPTIALAKNPDGTDVIEVTGLDATGLAAWAKDNPSESRWRDLLYVEVGSSPTPLAGRYDVDSGVLRFTPRYPLLASQVYRGYLRHTRLPGSTASYPPMVVMALKLPRPADVPPPVIVRVYPTADKLPENLLKFYIHFSAPMQRGDVYDYIKLFDENGKQVFKPFLEVGEELWDPAGKRLTLLLDPGRVKQGLKPREEFGPVLESGHEYTLLIEPEVRDATGRVSSQWCDAYGSQLTGPHRIRFRAVPPETRPIEPAEWSMSAPPAGTRKPLSIDLKRPLDHALLHRVVRVVTADGKPVEGDVKLGEYETTWHFTPRANWAAGEYVLEAESILEDLAGNRIGRSFEVDETGPQRDDPPTVYRRSFKIQ
jgi:hypothetical protein